MGATSVFFRSPSGGITCEISDGSTAPQQYASCETTLPAESVTISVDGSINDCRGVSCLGNPPGDDPTLGYGQMTHLGPFTCGSTTAGIDCDAAGRTFEISRSGIRHG